MVRTKNRILCDETRGDLMRLDIQLIWITWVRIYDVWLPKQNCCKKLIFTKQQWCMLVQSHLSYLSGHCKNNNLHLYRTVFTIMAPISQYLAQKINYFIFLFLKPLLDICSFNGEVVGDDSVGHVERSLKAHYSLENISIFFCLVVFANRN